MKKAANHQVGAFEAKTHFSALLERVAGGEIIDITRRGKPVAKLIPAQEGTSAQTRAVIAEIRRLRQGRRLRGLSIRALIETGRRY